MQMTRELGARLRTSRTRRDVHHAIAAELAGMSERAWVELEMGLRARWAGLPMLNLMRVCDAVGTHPAVLFLGL